MANLTPITQGMQNGAQAIQSNFSALNSAKVEATNVYERDASADNSAFIKSGGVILRRTGNVCFALVNGQAAKDIQPNTDYFIKFPNGFVPSGRYVYRPADGSTINIWPQGVSSDTKIPMNNYLVWGLTWATNDPMPS